MKIGVSCYSYHREIQAGNMTVLDAIAHAKRAGSDAIEFTDHAITDENAPIDEIRACCEENGLEISAYAVWADFLNPHEGDLRREVERIKRAAGLCRRLGARILRHDASWGFAGARVRKARSIQDAVRQIAPAIREVSEYAQDLGVKTCCENHGYFFQDSRRMEALVEAVDHDNFGLLVDIGNFACADEPPELAVGLVAPYAIHVHAKDFLHKCGAEGAPDDSWFPTRGGHWLRGTVLGHGFVPVAQCIRVLKGSGYKGTVSLEFEGLERTVEAVEIGVRTLRRICGDGE